MISSSPNPHLFFFIDYLILQAISKHIVVPHSCAT